MEDVQVGIRLEAGGDPVHPVLEARLLLGARLGPQRPVAPLVAVAVAVDGAEEVLEARVAPVRVALEVEEDVALRRLRQASEPTAVLRLVQLVERRVETAA